MKQWNNNAMKQIIIIGILAVLTLLNLNCGDSKEIIEIKPKVIYPPVIEDSIKASGKTDTVITGFNIIRNDTVTIVKYFPKLEKFYIKVKPDSIVIFDTVKTMQTIEKNIETPFLSKIGLVMIGFLITIIGTYLLGKRG